jgi:uncharacterized protein YbbC (DUF1343 family)
MKQFLKCIDILSKAILVFFVTFLFVSCSEKDKSFNRVGVLATQVEANIEVIPAAENIAEYYDLLKGKTVSLVVNQTSIIGNKHLVDSLLGLNVQIKTIFAPEHGFRGKADAGEKIKDGIDGKTGLPLISLYGKKKKPTKEDLEGVEVMVFDIQDVGARFYTYISSLHYVMESCAENGIKLIVLDRPNPNGHYVDGPVLEKEFTSFVGMHPVPVIYGTTIGEYAQMINGEGWLAGGLKADLTVMKIKNYTHDTFYELPVKPSPNLPNIQSILLYPSLCFFEGSHVSIGRGTTDQFQVVGHPKFTDNSFSFVPKSMEGAKYPKHENVMCFGLNLKDQTKRFLYDQKQLNLTYLLEFYNELHRQNLDFFLDNNFFEKLAGTSKLRNQIVDGVSEKEIRQSWEEDLEKFKKVRAKYLIYQ